MYFLSVFSLKYVYNFSHSCVPSFLTEHYMVGFPLYPEVLMETGFLIYLEYSIVWMYHCNLFINFPTIKTDVGCFYYSICFIFLAKLSSVLFCVWAPWFQGLAGGVESLSFAELPSAHHLQRKAQLMRRWQKTQSANLTVIMSSIWASHMGLEGQKLGARTVNGAMGQRKDRWKSARVYFTVWIFFLCYPF